LREKVTCEKRRKKRKEGKREKKEKEKRRVVCNLLLLR
jgi:hypothetical protein